MQFLGSTSWVSFVLLVITAEVSLTQTTSIDSMLTEEMTDSHLCSVEVFGFGMGYGVSGEYGGLLTYHFIQIKHNDMFLLSQIETQK